MKLKESVRRAWNAIRAWIISHRKLSIAIACVVFLILVISLVSSKNGQGEMIVVANGDVVEQVRVAGRVEADIVADIGFENGGTVRTVSAATNDIVRKGQRLVSLDLGTLPSELASAQASVAIKRAQLTNTETNIESLKDKQDALVATAYQNLLSQGLVLEPESSTYTQTAPVITGRYAGSEGTYKVIIDRGVQGNLKIRTFDLEQTPDRVVEKTGPTPLGTKGLFISFPDELGTYVNTTWYLEIPNTKSSQYLSNYNAYQEALRERDRAVDEAEGEVREQVAGGSIAQAELLQAQAEVSRIQALIGQRILSAPFDGVITSVQVDPGESVTPGTAAVSMISTGVLGIEVDLPEIDSVKVMTGDTVAITLDAFGDKETFTGTVVSVNRAETVVDGVSVYEARIAFDTKDERIVSGMTADVVIETNRKDGVVAIPVRAVKYKEDGTPYVTVQATEKKTKEREIAIGVRGSNSMVQVLAGLDAGETIVITETK